ncbi:unnamed protein product [Allacma fusca]|uniref:Uncharacterized protein n=1 Tax=Allacma fusca TaxID=39272 RepID=A0A8J2K6K5_9HEXA|nr:unnamed protein product [Allacma fusca]
MGEKREQSVTAYYDCRHPELDAGIGIAECKVAQKKIKNAKAPGIDGIRGEFLKALPENFIQLYLRVFNGMLEVLASGSLRSYWNV